MDDPEGLNQRQLLTYRLGRISEVEAELCYQLREVWRVVYGQTRQVAEERRLTSGALLNAIGPELKKVEYDWIGECRAAVHVVREAVNARNDALHNEWYVTDTGYVSLHMIQDSEPGLAITHFEEIARRLDIASDFAVGMAGLLRAHQSRQLQWPVDEEFEKNCRNLVAETP